MAKKTAPHDPAFARPLSHLSPEEWSNEQEGLSKREYMATHVMAAVCSRHDAKPVNRATLDALAEMACKAADALVEKLGESYKVEDEV